MVQRKDDQNINWIIETKGRVWEGTKAKDEAIQDWCKRVSEAVNENWKYVRVNQKDFDSSQANSLQKLLEEPNLGSSARSLLNE